MLLYYGIFLRNTLGPLDRSLQQGSKPSVTENFYVKPQVFSNR